MFMINNKNLRYIVHYYSKFPVVKKVAGLSADGPIHAVKMTFAEFRLSRKIILDEDTTLLQEMFKEFCRKLNIQQSTLSPYHHQTNGQVEA